MIAAVYELLEQFHDS
jgi:hypothetical protein